MKKLFSKLSKISLGVIAVSAPILIGLSSCAKEEHYATESIKLSSRPAYICPGETLKVHKNIYPVEARGNQVKWEIIEKPRDGFTISNEGIVTAPSGVTLTEPQFITVKATDVENPEISDQLSIAFINKPTTDTPFLGFVGSKIDFYDRDGEIQSYAINKIDEKSYEVEKPINLFIGHTKDAIEFVPVVLKGKNSRMKFHLHGDDQSLRSLAWNGYSDNTWTDEIPSFSVSHVQHRHDCMDVTFACDKEITFHIDFEVWQSEEQETPGVMSYGLPETDPNYYEIEEIGLGQYSSEVQIPETSEESTVRIIDQLLVYRKPYEFLDDITFTIEKSENCPLTEGVDFTITDIAYERNVIFPFTGQEGYRVSFTYTVTSNVKALDYSYESIPLFEVKAWTPRMPESPMCYCAFFAHWYVQEE